MSVEADVRKWLELAPVRFDDESDPAFLMRRGSEWDGLTGCAGWGDFVRLVERARGAILGELIAGTRDRFGNACDDEKRAMIKTFDIILSLPSQVQREADDARRMMAEWAARRRA